MLEIKKKEREYNQKAAQPALLSVNGCSRSRSVAQGAWGGTGAASLPAALLLLSGHLHLRLALNLSSLFNFFLLFSFLNLWDFQKMFFLDTV